MSAAPSVREALLDATGTEIDRTGWPAVRMADVATAAGVSRQTLYNEFGSREALGQAYVLRESDRFLEAVETAVRAAGPDGPEAAVTAALETFFRGAADNTLIRHAIADTGGEGLLPLLTTQGRPVVERAAARLAAVVIETFPGIAPEPTARLADTLVRVAISYATLPAAGATARAGGAARSVAALLAPLLRELTGRA